MPLINSPSDAARSQNIAEMIKSFKRKGSIGKTKPKSGAHARKIAIAAAFSNQRRQGG